MLPSGELYVVDTAPEDSLSQYRCRTLHRLTGKTQESVTAGRLQVIGTQQQTHLFIRNIFLFILL